MLAPGSGCLVCRDRIDLQRAAAEMLPPDEHRRLADEGYAPALPGTDLMTLKVYEVNGAQVALPQRVSPDLSTTIPPITPGRARPAVSTGVLSDGPDAFRASIEAITGETRRMFDELIAWAEQLALLPYVRLFTYSGAERYTLLPRIMPDDVGLITIWNDHQHPYISVWRSVFERLAPNSIESVERVIAPIKIGQGNTVRNVTSQLLDIITKAYQETVRS